MCHVFPPFFCSGVSPGHGLDLYRYRALHEIPLNTHMVMNGPIFLGIPLVSPLHSFFSQKRLRKKGEP
jgi:hypothetical protein